MSPLAAFSSITIHNCLTSGMDGTSIPLDLNLSISFPAPRYDMREDTSPLSASWDALSLPTTAGHLDLTLVPSIIGEGRIGLVYFASVNTATDEEGNDISGNMPAEVCLKIAKPTYCRSLAREAWFYEQLQVWQGVATAKCYGLFTAPVPPDTSVRPWKESDEFPHEFRLPQSDVESADWLPDDPIGRAYKFSLESLHVVEGSSWFKWTPDEKDQRLAILVLEKLGPHYYSQDEEPKTDREALHESVRFVVDDICLAGVLHTDITAYNILRAPPGEQARCSKHQCSHEWRLVDFDRCWAASQSTSDRYILKELSHQKDFVGQAKYCFWGARV